MSTTQNLKMGLAAFTASLLLLSLNAVAAPIPRDPNMEASAGCKECFKPSLDMGLDGVAAQVQKVNIFDAKGEDPRYPQKTTGEGAMFSPIGRIVANQSLPININGKIEMRKDVPGTGFLVSPCLVVTNYHVVFGESKNPNKSDFAVTFQTAAGKVRGTPVIWGPVNTSDDLENDWALLELDAGQCIGREVGWLTAGSAAEARRKNIPVTLAGFASKPSKNGSPEQLLRSKDGKIIEFDTGKGAGTVLHDVSMSRGQSGAPLGYVEDGVFKVVAVNSFERNPTAKILKNYSKEHANIAITLSSILRNGPSDLIAADRKKNGIKNPLLSASL